MIDLVQRSLEKMASELKNYQERGIFTEKELHKILDERRRFENRLQRADKRLQDYLQYIESEKKLEKIRNKRLKSLHLPRSEYDILLTKNIIGIYRRALHYFSEPILVKEFSEYAIEHSEHEELKSILGDKCAKNIKDVDLWIFVAQKLWEINDAEEARSVFLKCVSINKSLRLLVEFFRFECAYVERLLEISKQIGIDEPEGDIERGDLALVVFKDLLSKGASSEEVNECIKIASTLPQLLERITKECNVGI